jgi:hypothetical protein
LMSGDISVFVACSTKVSISKWFSSIGGIKIDAC